MQLNKIGSIHANEQNQEFYVEIDEPYRPAMKELEKFSHLHLIWWADKNDTKELRKITVSEDLPPFYGENAPSMGVFANRSEYRPNPIAITTTPIISVDLDSGIIVVPWCDAFDGTPVIDIKPYLKMTDLVNQAKYPPYLSHWPNSQEEAAAWWAKRLEDSE